MYVRRKANAVFVLTAPASPRVLVYQPGEGSTASAYPAGSVITRAGPGTKIVCLGNLAQIDTPYLTEGSSGLTFAVDKFKGWPHGGHITLARGERSRLADFASEVL